MERIKKALLAQFENYRIVFWYDAGKELRGQFQELDLPGIDKIEIKNNQVWLKHKVLRLSPRQKFLLYHEGPEPAYLDNWLLDVQLSNGRFRTHQLAIQMAELALPDQLEPQLEPHSQFFNVKSLRDKLKNLLKPDDSITQIRLKMLAVLTSAQPRFDAVTENLLEELAQKKGDKFNRIEDYQLETFFWEQLNERYGYQSQAPAIGHFAISLFRHAYAKYLQPSSQAPTDAPSSSLPPLCDDAIVFLKRWKESTRHQKAFAKLSRRFQQEPAIAEDLRSRDYKSFKDLDLFPSMEEKILEGLVQDVSQRAISIQKCEEIVRLRRQGFWYSQFSHQYQAVSFASRFLDFLNQIHFDFHSLADGIEGYAQTSNQADHLYRKYCHHLDRVRPNPLLDPLTSLLEHEYHHNFLLKINNAWKRHANSAITWQAPGREYHKNFFKSHVKPILDRAHKVCVIISPSLRFEAGRELLRLLRREDRHHVQIEPALAVLPAAGQPGEIALLPHREIKAGGFDENAFIVDGRTINHRSEKGGETDVLSSYQKILCRAVQGEAAAVDARFLSEMGKQEFRGLLKRNRLIYIFHHPADVSGNLAQTPDNYFKTVEHSLQELLSIIKRLSNEGAANLLVTSDRGFIYQGGTGINRLYHGMSLQEAIVPVLHIKRNRGGNMLPVEVDILNGTSGLITGGQLNAVFFQVDPVDDKRHSRECRAGIYTKSHQLISESHRILFDLTSPNHRDREIQKSFILTREAAQAKDQEVYLRLEEFNKETSAYRNYKVRSYMLRHSFNINFETP